VWNPQSPNQAKPLPAAVPPKGCSVRTQDPQPLLYWALHHGKPALRHVPLHEQQRLSKTGQSDASIMQPLRSGRACSRDGGGLSRSVHHHTATLWLAAPEHAHKLHNLLAPKPAKPANPSAAQLKATHQGKFSPRGICPEPSSQKNSSAQPLLDCGTHTCTLHNHLHATPSITPDSLTAMRKTKWSQLRSARYRLPHTCTMHVPCTTWNVV
jgi:hypothetical protein